MITSGLEWDTLSGARPSYSDDALDSGDHPEFITLPADGLYTPPPSEPESSPLSDRWTPPASIAVSTAFPPTATHDTHPSDLLVVSSDAVHFYLHAFRLQNASATGFNKNLPQWQTSMPLLLPESALVLNLVFHAVYNIPCSQYTASMEALSDSVTALGTYGVDVKAALSIDSPLGHVLCAQAPVQPLEVYALAASHDAEDLARAASAHLLSFPLCTLADEISARIGGPYLKRLLFLHLGRKQALKRLLIAPPKSHGVTSRCDLEDQKGLMRAWSLTVAYLGWEAKADTTSTDISSAFKSLHRSVTCLKCQSELSERVRELVLHWSMVKATI